MFVSVLGKPRRVSVGFLWGFREFHKLYGKFSGRQSYFKPFQVEFT